MDDKKGSELEGLFVDDGDDAVDAVLRATLEKFVGITRDGKTVPKPAFLKLSDPQKILIALLARLAKVRLNIPGYVREGTADELASECIVPVKSCREYLSRLKARKLLEKADSGYFVPNWAVSNVAAEISKSS